jgi:beta-galactosidase
MICDKNRILMAIGLLLTAVSHLHAEETARTTISLNADWRYQKDDPAGVGDQLGYKKMKDYLLPSGNSMAAPDNQKQLPERTLDDKVSYAAINYDDKEWRAINLPHDFGLEGTFVPTGTNPSPPSGIGWYRKQLDLSPADSGKRIYLDMDGASSCPAVWLNGKYVGGWAYGYTSFRLDLTKHLQFGRKNVLAIRVESQPDPKRWYTEGGILRNVWLTKIAPVHVAHWGTTIVTPEVSGTAAKIGIKTRVENNSAKEGKISYATEIYAHREQGLEEKPILSSTTPVELSIPSQQTAEGTEQFTLGNPKLWTPDTPNLYMAVTTVRENGKPVDRYETVFGIRSTLFTTTDGFYLNDKRLVIKGVNLHRDLGALGTVVNSSALRYRLELLKTMGCNAIRANSAPASPELLDLCDRMGFLVISDFSDTWTKGRKYGSYINFFNDWADRDIRAWVRRDRNHASLIAWNIGENVSEQLTVEGIPFAGKLSALVRAEDTTRQVMIASREAKAGYNGMEKTVDVFGLNFLAGEYQKFHETNPDIPILASSSAGTYSSRGEYLFPVSEGKDYGRISFQVSSYDLYAPNFGRTPDAEFNALAQNPFVAGEFVLAGFDFLGDATPYNDELRGLIDFHREEERAAAEQELTETKRLKCPSRSSYYGIFDLAGFPKDRYYLYQAHWRPDYPMAHILPHWTWPGREGELTPVHVYTSGDEAELFLNGQSLGKKQRMENIHRLRWDDVKYAPGELKVVAYKDGKKWVEDVMSTAGAAAKLELYVNRKVFRADGQDIVFVTAKVVDGQGRVVPRANPKIEFAINGPGRIVATDNGDATNRESLLAQECRAYNGLALAIVGAETAKKGSMLLEAKAEGLAPAKIEIKSE